MILLRDGEVELKDKSREDTIVTCLQIEFSLRDTSGGNTKARVENEDTQITEWEFYLIVIVRS